jgi:hypothetical protein
MKTSELTGAALDWAVAKCEGQTEGKDFAWYYDRQNTFNYSTDWTLGGAIIEREGIAVWQFDDVTWRAIARYAVPDPIEGATPLVAAMRCYVISELGDDVEIPEEITQ